MDLRERVLRDADAGVKTWRPGRQVLGQFRLGASAQAVSQGHLGNRSATASAGSEGWILHVDLIRKAVAEAPTQRRLSTANASPSRCRSRP